MQTIRQISWASIAILIFSIFSAQNSLAQESETILSNLEIHGFLSQGYAQSTNNNFFPNSTQGTTQFSEVGFNVNKQLTPDLRAGFQLFARDYGEGENPGFQANFDWFLIDYHWRDWLGFRAGRIKLPFGLLNDTSDIDLARDCVLLPQSIYPYSDTNYLLAQTGFEVYGVARTESVGSFEYRFYRGTIEINNPLQPNTSPIQIDSLSVPYVYGGRLIWDTPLSGFRTGLSAQRLVLDTDLSAGATTASVTIPVTMAIGSIEYSYKSFQFDAEYSRWWASSDSSNLSLFPNTSEVSEKYYAMAIYRFGNSLRPGVYYAASFPDMSEKGASQDVWHDYAAFIRYDLNSYWIFKLEAHYMDGTAGLSPDINGGTPQSSMPRNWDLFLAKTTVSF